TDTATTPHHTLSLHDALPISTQKRDARREHAGLEVADVHHHEHVALEHQRQEQPHPPAEQPLREPHAIEHVVAIELLDLEERARSEEHTSELQSRENLVCRLL